MKSQPANKEESLRIQIALGSITVLLIANWLLAFMIVESALADNGFRALHRDPGLAGLNFITYIVPYYALIPVYVYLVRDFRLRAFRWVAVAMSGLGFVFWILHHLSHWRFGQRPTFTSHVVELTLHTVGLWLLVSSIRWAKLLLPARDLERVSVAGHAALQES